MLGSVEADDQPDAAPAPPRPARKRAPRTAAGASSKSTNPSSAARRSASSTSAPITGSTAVVEREAEAGLDVPLDVPLEDEVDPSAPLVPGVPDAAVVEDPSLPIIVPALPTTGPQPLVTAAPPVTVDGRANGLSPAVLAELSGVDASAPIEMPAPVLRQPRLFGRRPRPRVRRVTRIVRHVDTWSVFKVALVFHVFLYAVLMTSGVLLWQVAESTGTIDNVEKFFESFGWETFQFDGGQIFHNAWIGGLFLVVALTGLAVLAATLFNLITDLVGGVRFSVLEEEVLSRADRGTASRGIPRPELPPDATG
jgi:hypothetical protein